MVELTEVRWHGRGGQGAKTASILLAEAASAAGKFVQGFPEYGPERMGAPMLAFNRISDQEITLHCHVANPSLVVVLDSSLLESVDVTEGVDDDGIIVVNTPRSPSEIRDKLGTDRCRVFCVDANEIATETLGRAIPNTPMLAALVKVAGMMDWDEFLAQMKEQLEYKFKDRPEIVEGNLKAIERAAQEVRGE